MLRCSHILCKVANISAAVTSLEKAGFSMQWGSSPSLAHNALLWFEHGPFIEFFELPRRFAALSFPFGLRHGRAAGQRLAHWAKAAPGWCDVALEPVNYDQQAPLDLQAARQLLRENAVSSSRIIHGRRICPQGSEVKYRFLTPAPVSLPFIVSHYQPLQRPAQINHANGAKGVAQVNLALPAIAYLQLKQLLPHDPWLFTHPGLSQPDVTEHKAAEHNMAGHIAPLQLAGWRPAPDTDPFIHSLFLSSASEGVCIK